MPRIVGIEGPKEKQTEIALTYIFGVGRANAKVVLAKAQVDPSKRAKDLTDEEISRLTQTIQSDHKVEGDLRRDVAGNIRRLIDIGSYRGLRHKKGLPVRGQRTRTNARTRKGPRPRVGVRKRTKVPVGSSRATS